MNIKKIKDVMDKNDISEFDIIKDYSQLLINSYKTISIAIKNKVDEIRIPTLIQKLKKKSDLYLIYNSLILLYDNYPNKKFILEKYKYKKNSHYFIYSVNKVNYLVFSYEKEAPIDKFWLYYFDDKIEMLNFIKEEL